MYHIFLIIATISSQNQIVNIEQQFEQQKAAHIRSVQAAKSGNKEDVIISQLKKQVEAEEKAIKPDLESLGLDPIDTKPHADASSKTLPLEKTKKADAVAVNSIVLENLPDIKQDLPKIKNPTKEDLTKIAQLENIADKPTSKEGQALPSSNNVIDSNIAKDVKVEKDSPVIDLEATKEEQSKKQGFIKKIVSKLKTDEQPTEQAKPDIIKEKPVEVEKDAPKDDAKPTDIVNNDEKKELEKKKREERIAKRRALLELKQQQKIQKLEALRQKYLQQGEGDDVYEGVSRYQIVSKIIPQKKIPPKFLNSEVPSPLLNRFRGFDNKHHPIIISNSEKIDFMFQAIAQNRIDDFNSIFNLIKNPNIKNSFGDTLLTFAILMGRHDAVSSLISKGANPDLANDLGYTPLNIAIEMVDYKSTSILVGIGNAKVDFVDDLGRTYLMQAARVGSLPITDLLISKGVDVNIADNNGITALAIAQKHKKDIIAKYLLKYGAQSWVKKNYVDDDSSMVEDLFNKWK
jgi:hypothetical protein